MRALLKLFVTATAALAWTAGVPPEPPPRAAPPPPAAACVDLRPAPGTRAEPPEVVVVEEGAAPVPAPPEKPIPLAVVAVDGETGEVLLPEAGRGEARPGTEAAVEVAMQAPAGYVAQKAYSIDGYVSRRAERVRVLAPLRREAEVTLQVLDATGRPVRGARVTSVRMGGGEPSVYSWTERHVIEPPEPELPLPEPALPEAEGEPVAFRADPTDGDGWTRVRGVPALLDERFWIAAAEGDREGFVGLATGALRERHVLELRLPRGVTSVEVLDRLGGCFA